MQFQHKGLTETHHLGSTLATWREIGTSFCSTHRECGERVFEHLLKSQKLQNAQIHRRVETQPAFVRTDSIVVLHTVTHVGADVALVVHPSDAESVDALGDAQTFDEIHLVKLRVFVILFLNR